jgi:membrane protein implicated in regulation of membrane protease activity
VVVVVAVVFFLSPVLLLLVLVLEWWVVVVVVSFVALVKIGFGWREAVHADGVQRQRGEKREEKRSEGSVAEVIAPSWWSSCATGGGTPAVVFPASRAGGRVPELPSPV